MFIVEEIATHRFFDDAIWREDISVGIESESKTLMNRIDENFTAVKNSLSSWDLITAVS